MIRKTRNEASRARRVERYNSRTPGAKSRNGKVVAIPSRRTKARADNLPGLTPRRTPVQAPRKTSDAVRFQSVQSCRRRADGASFRCVFPPIRTKMEIHRGNDRLESEADAP